MQNIFICLLCVLKWEALRLYDTLGQGKRDCNDTAEVIFIS